MSEPVTYRSGVVGGHSNVCQCDACKAQSYPVCASHNLKEPCLMCASEVDGLAHHPKPIEQQAFCDTPKRRVLESVCNGMGGGDMRRERRSRPEMPVSPKSPELRSGEHCGTSTCFYFVRHDQSECDCICYGCEGARSSADAEPMWSQTQAKLEEVTKRAHRYEQENIALRRDIERLERNAKPSQLSVELHDGPWPELCNTTIGEHATCVAPKPCSLHGEMKAG